MDKSIDSHVVHDVRRSMVRARPYDGVQDPRVKSLRGGYYVPRCGKVLGHIVAGVFSVVGGGSYELCASHVEMLLDREDLCF